MNKSIPWGWVVFGLILFWPIGLILLLKKIHTDKSATLRSGRLVALTSYVLFFLTFMCGSIAHLRDGQRIASSIFKNKNK